MPPPRNRNYFLPQYQTALGTVVHATPVVEALKAAQPDARIVVASSGLAAQVWEGNPHLEQLLHMPSPLQNFIGAVKAFHLVSIFHGEPYTTLLTTGNERTKITLAALLAGRSTRVGFAVHSALVQKHLLYDPTLSQIANNLRLVTAVDADISDASSEPRLYPVRGVGGMEDSLVPVGRPRIALATQTSATQRKSWLPRRWVELATELRTRYEAELIFVGTSAEADAIDDLRNAIPFPTVSLAGRTSIQELAAWLQRSDLGIMLDTGPLHVARAVGLPAVIIAPAWSPVHEWLPVGNPHYRILKNADFLPPAPADYTITEVSVAEVLEAAGELLVSPRSVDAAAERTRES